MNAVPCRILIGGTKGAGGPRPCRNRTTDPSGACAVHRAHETARHARAASMPRPPHTHECLCSVCQFPNRRAS